MINQCHLKERNSQGMIDIILSEKDFDYELQALVNSFFPGHKCLVWTEGKEKQGKGKLPSAEDNSDGIGSWRLAIRIFLGQGEIAISVLGNGFSQSRNVLVGCGDDWHRHEDKSAHPYRTYYKNELKRLLFYMLRDWPEEALPEGVAKRIPAWGTMTGVRPTKIPMQALLSGKSIGQTRQDLERWYCCTEEKRELCLDIALREAELLKGVDYKDGYSLYIGIPFCPTTCLYCSFPSYPCGQSGKLIEDYLKALKKEMAAVAAQCRGRRLTSVYVGGGTPTALSAGQLDGLLSCAEQYFSVKEGCEFTVEAGRPDSITKEKLAVLREHGVGRISVNPQTMQQKTLALIGRKHTVADTVQAFCLAREMGFSNVNMDLIAGLPGETVDDFCGTLRQIGELNPDSVTVHSLVVKRASKLRNVLDEAGGLGGLAEAENVREGQMDQMFSLTQQFARGQGYSPYYMYRQKNAAGYAGSSGQENIGYARKGKECLYNILMMEEMQTVIALGAGASTKKYHAGRGIVSRIENVKNVDSYISRVDEMIQRKENIFA